QPRGPAFTAISSSPISTRRVTDRCTDRGCRPVFDASLAKLGYASLPESFAQSAMASRTRRSVGSALLCSHTQDITRTLTHPPAARLSPWPQPVSRVAGVSGWTRVVRRWCSAGPLGGDGDD